VTEKAPKLDAGKPRLDLIHPHFLFALGRVMAFGAKKYAAWSWTRGKEWSKDHGAALRHIAAWYGGEDVDPESGEPHLAHACCDLMFLLVSQAFRLGTDDRPRVGLVASSQTPVTGKPDDRRCTEKDCDFCFGPLKTKELR
jgi:hypothetical protein